MPYNPCGALVEWGRHRYRTECRFFRDSDVTATIVWYPCHEDAEELPYDHPILQSVWDREGDDYLPRSGVGEVWGSPHVTDNMRPVPGARGQHLCGTEQDFEFGAAFDPDADVQYRPDGLPVCCPGFVPAGLLWGGRWPPPIAGGLLWGGNWEPLVVFSGTNCTNSLGPTTVADGREYTLLIAPFYAGSTQVFLTLLTNVSGNYRIRFRGFQPGGVSITRWVWPFFCLFSATLFTGPSDVPFEFDLTAAPGFFYVLSVGTPPDPYAASIFSVTPLP